MFGAVIFDLDGTLVQTEKLKARSYARAAVELSSGSVEEDEVVEAFKEVVGKSRRDVSQYLMERFELTEAARVRMKELGGSAPWQAYVRVRLRIYDRMLEDPDIVRAHRWPHNLELLERVREQHCRMGLATMSHDDQARRILEILELDDAFDFVATRDDVENPKPDPEIYLLAADALGVPPEECLVIEDSPSGVRSAKSAGTAVIAVTTPLTRAAFQNLELLERRWIVDEPARLPEVVHECLMAHQRTSHGG